MALENKMCYCGKPLHYNSRDVGMMVEGFVQKLGEFIPIETPDGMRYKVPRHYIALHGIRTHELKGLGFEVIKDE
jgi:hypothetical protein